MKHTTIILSLLLLLPLTAAAEQLGSHCLAVWGQGGVSSYVGKADMVKASLGGGGAIGVGYEYRGNKFLLQTGLAARYTNTGFNFKDNVFGVDGQFIDDEGWPIKRYEWQESNRRDSYDQVALQVPLMVGGHFNQFYFLVGAKLNVNMYNSVKVKGDYRSLGYYDQFIDPFENMDNHKYFTMGSLSGKNTSPLSINAAAAVEIGGEFTIKDERGSGRQYLRVAGFLDFNLLDDSHRGYNDLITFPGRYEDIKSLQDIRQQDYLHSAVANPMRQLFAGVKLTFLLSSKVRYNCVMCEGGYPSRRDQRRGSRLLLN